MPHLFYLGIPFANPTKWSNTLRLSVFDHFVGVALKGLIKSIIFISVGL